VRRRGRKQGCQCRASLTEAALCVGLHPPVDSRCSLLSALCYMVSTSCLELTESSERSPAAGGRLRAKAKRWPAPLT
jgi:hypothetical protein